MVEGWEPESGRVRVRVAGESVKVWLSEIVAMGVGPEEQIAGERKRRTMSEPNSAAAMREDGVKRPRLTDGPARSGGFYTAAQAESSGRKDLSRPSLLVQRNRRGGMRNSAIASIAGDVRAVMRGIWKWGLI